MDQTWKEKLLVQGVSEAAIAVLAQQEFERELDMKRGYSYEQFLGMGIAAKSAGILADLYPMPAAPTPVTTSASSTKLYLGKEPLEELVKRAAGGDADAIADLGERVGDRTVFVRSLATGKIDVEASLACIQFCGPTGEVDHWGPMPTESLSSILLARRQVNPITRRVLTPGDPWLSIPTERRVLPLFGQQAGLLQQVDEDSCFEQLSKPQLTGRWERIEKAYQLAKLRQDPKALAAESLLFDDPPAQNSFSRSDRPKRERRYEPLEIDAEVYYRH